MRGYLAILRCRFAALLQYRQAALAAFATQIFWGIVKVMILQAFYAQSIEPQPITLSQAITFIWLGQALLQLLPWFFDKEIESQIKNGDVAYELVRPLDLYWLWFYRCMAIRLIPTLMRIVPLFIIAVLFFGLTMPISMTAGFFFILSIICAVILSSAITTILQISLFWTLSGEGIQRLAPHVTMLLAGMIVPLPLFPVYMQPFLNAQPFRGIVDIPSRLYTGIIPANEGFYYLFFQLGWAAIIILAGKWMMRKALQRVVIQGG